MENDNIKGMLARVYIANAAIMGGVLTAAYGTYNGNKSNVALGVVVGLSGAILEAANNLRLNRKNGSNGSSGNLENKL